MALEELNVSSRLRSSNRCLLLFIHLVSLDTQRPSRLEPDDTNAG